MSTPFQYYLLALLTYGLFSLLSISEYQDSLSFHTLLQSSLLKIEVSDLPSSSSYSITYQPIVLATFYLVIFSSNCHGIIMECNNAGGWENVPMDFGETVQEGEVDLSHEGIE